jgi:hypothetical protein
MGAVFLWSLCLALNILVGVDNGVGFTLSYRLPAAGRTGGRYLIP